MLDKLMTAEINAEIIAALIFSIISGSYLLLRNGPGELVNSLFLWMFPASIMIFLTLILVKIIEMWHNRRTSRYHYLDWRRH